MKAAVDAAVAKDPASVLVLGSARLSTEENWLLAQLFRESSEVPHVEFHADVGPERQDQEPGRARRLARTARRPRRTPAAPRPRASAPRRRGLGPRSPPRRVVLPRRPLHRRRDIHRRAPPIPAFVAVLRRAKSSSSTRGVKNALDRGRRHRPPRGEPRREGRDVRERPRPRPAVRPAPSSRRRSSGPTSRSSSTSGRGGASSRRSWTAADVFDRMKGSVPGYAGLDWDSDGLVGNAPSASLTSAYDVLGLETAPRNPKRSSRAAVRAPRRT